MIEYGLAECLGDLPESEHVEVEILVLTEVRPTEAYLEGETVDDG